MEEAGFEGTFSSTERLRERMRSLSAMINGEKSIIIAAAVEAAQKISAPSSIKDHLYKSLHVNALWHLDGTLV